MWRDWVAQSERQWNGFLNKAMATDEFSQTLGRSMDFYLNMQKSMNEAMGRYLTTVNVPTRDDVLALGDRLAGIEARLASLENGIASLQAGSGKPAPAASSAATAARPRPPRTKKPPSKA